MYRYFEDLVDPFQPFENTTPPDRVLPYIWSQARTLGIWLPIMVTTSLLVAIVPMGFALRKVGDWVGNR